MLQLNVGLDELVTDINMLEGMIYLNSLLIEKIHGNEITEKQYEALTAADEIMGGIISNISTSVNEIV